MTRYVSEAELNANLAKVLDEVQLEGDAVIVTRPNGERVIVQRLPTPDEMDTTEYLLSNPANARTLMESIAELEAGNGQEHELLEL